MATLAAVLLLFAVWTEDVFAGEGRVNGSTLEFVADPGETNDVGVTLAGGFYIITDGVLPIRVGAGCSPGISPSEIRCPAAGLTSLKIQTADGDDTVVVLAGIDTTIEGGTGRDRLHGRGGNDTITGGDGDDYLGGWEGSDSIDGGAGSDELYGDESDQPGQFGADILTGGAGSDQLYGRAGDDTLNGGADGDALIGGVDDDSENGGPGPDTLYQDFGVTGTDDLSGGDGIDTASYDRGGETVTVTIDGVANDGTAEDDNGSRRDNVVTDIEQLRGGSGSDHFTGSAGANLIYGFEGADVLAGGGGEDTLIGNQGADALDGGPGDDILEGGLAGDTITGGGEIDTVDYSLSDLPVTVDLDFAVGDDGASGEGDTVATDVEDIIGSRDSDTLTGDADDNVLHGGLGDDELAGLAGDDHLDGAEGDDLLTGGTGADELIGGPGFGFDIVVYTDHIAAVSADLAGDPGDGSAGENDTVAADVDGLIGGSGADTLLGDFARNLLVGGPGNDHLVGDNGYDVLEGENGDDRLDTRDGGIDEANCGAGSDTVVGDGPDLIDASCELVDRGPAPTVVSGGVSAITTTSAVLGATVNANGQATSVLVEIGPTTAYGTRSPPRNIGTAIDPVGLEATITGLNPGTTYHYRWQGENAAGTSFAADQTFTTLGTAPSPPVIPPPPVLSPPSRPRVRCAVPNVRGKTLAKARRALQQGHCRLGKIRRAHSSKVRRGRVISQSRRPGARLANGTRVNLILSRGSRLTAT